ncbi:hypothetical protein OkiPb00243_48680 [Escherichia coli]
MKRNELKLKKQNHLQHIIFTFLTATTHKNKNAQHIDFKQKNHKLNI